MYMKLDIFPLKAIDENPTSKLKEFSMNSQNVSTWMAKRQRSKVERDLDVLKNRINLLSQVERKAKKQLNEIKAKANKAIETKLAIEEQNSKNQNKSNNKEEELQKNILESRKKREEKQKSSSTIRESLKRLKIEESQEIKRTKNENEKKLKLLKEELSKQNHEKKNKIKKDLEISKRKVDKFWEMKQKQLGDQHLLEICEQEAIKKLKETELDELEKKENHLLKKLDNTQNLHIHLCEKLENVFILSSQDFFNIYGKEIKSKNKINEKLNTQQ